MTKEKKHGWYCPYCEQWIKASDVTFEEDHYKCGTKVLCIGFPPISPEPPKEVTDEEILITAAAAATSPTGSNYEQNKQCFIAGAEWMRSLLTKEEK